jgi:hypothetical protein
MSRKEKVSTSDAQEISVESASGVNNIKENSMSPHDLLKINVNEHTEKKNGLTYLSWAWAWREALKADQSATFDVQTFEGNPTWMSMAQAWYGSLSPCLVSHVLVCCLSWITRTNPSLTPMRLPLTLPSCDA